MGSIIRNFEEIFWVCSHPALNSAPKTIIFLKFSKFGIKIYKIPHIFQFDFFLNCLSKFEKKNSKQRNV